MKDWNVSRRDLLKTLGVGAACLPLLHVTKAFGQASLPVVRHGSFQDEDLAIELDPDSVF